MRWEHNKEHSLKSTESPADGGWSWTIRHLQTGDFLCLESLHRWQWIAFPVSPHTTHCCLLLFLPASFALSFRSHPFRVCKSKKKKNRKLKSWPYLKVPLAMSLKKLPIRKTPTAELGSRRVRRWFGWSLPPRWLLLLLLLPLLPPPLSGRSEGPQHWYMLPISLHQHSAALLSNLPPHPALSPGALVNAAAHRGREGGKKTRNIPFSLTGRTKHRWHASQQTNEQAVLE